MMKLRLSKHGDDVHVTAFPWQKLKRDAEGNPLETEQEFMDRMTVGHAKHAEHWAGLEIKDIDDSELPSRDTREQWMPDFADNGKPAIEIDTNWEKKLMKPWLIRVKQLARLESKIDAELEKPQPNAVSLMRFQRDKEKMLKLDLENKQDLVRVYQQAIANMDEDGHAKPVVRQKIQDKLQELSSQ